ncbi:MAG: family transcriptional regulator [Glaciihabitans sp.]|nr:family transcriptional regulator [Glaciihabitans sp.]
MSPQSNRFAHYLKARREQLKPEDVGFPSDPDRRVKGLKREEVAALAGISPEYYTRLEQGRSYQLSASVLAGLASALKLDSYAAAYLYRLALPELPVRAATAAPVVSDTIRQLVAEWPDVPVSIFDRNQDILVMNDLLRALLPNISPGSNIVISAFSMPPEYRATEQWQAFARTVVSALRVHGIPTDARLQEIVGDLSIRDATFRALWADHDAIPFDSGVVIAYIEGFGVADFPWQNLNLPDGLFMGIWAAPQGSLAGRVIDHFRHILCAGLVPVEAERHTVTTGAVSEPARRSDTDHQLDAPYLALRPALLGEPL